MPIRVSELAKELGTDSKTLLPRLRSMGVGVGVNAASAHISLAVAGTLRGLPPGELAPDDLAWEPDEDSFWERDHYDPWDQEPDRITTQLASWLCRVKPATIRQWVARGYLVPLDHTHGRQRMYAKADVRRAFNAVRARTTVTPVPLAGIRRKDFDALISGVDAARLVGVSPSTIRMWVKRGLIAPCSGGPRTQLFKVIDVLKVARR